MERTTEPQPAATATPPSTMSDPAPSPSPAPETEATIAPAPPPPASSPQQQPQPSTSSSAPSQPGTPQIPPSTAPFPSLQHPINPNSQPQPHLQSQAQLQSQFHPQPQPPTAAPPPQPQPQAQPQQAQQRPPQPARGLRPTQPSFSSPLPSPVPSLPSSSGPLQRGGMAIGVPAALHHPRAQQQTPVQFSSFGSSATFGQTFNGLPRSSVGIPNQAASAGAQVRQPVQAIQNVGVVGAHATASMRPGGVPGNHQQRPGPPTLRSASPSPSNIQPPTGQKFQSHGLIRGPSVSSPGSPLPGPSQSSQPLQQPWMTTQGRPTNPTSLSTPSYRPQNKPQGSQQRPHQPLQQQQSMPTTLHQQQMPTSQQQQKLLQHSQQQQHQKQQQLQQQHQQQQLQQTQQQQQQLQQQQHQQQQLPLQPQQQQQQQVSLPMQSIAKVQQSVHQQQQLPRSASQKTLVPASLQQGATQPSPTSPTAGTDVGESGNRILSKRSIHELVTQIDPSEKLDPEVEEILVDIAEDFVESITTFGCALAKHRKSTTLEAKDILLHLERNWNMTIPGFGGDEIKCYKKPFTNDIHKERLSLIKKSMVGTDAGNAKNSAAGQTATNSKSHAPRPPLIGSPKVT